MKVERVEEILRRFPSKRILVIVEVKLDEPPVRNLKLTNIHLLSDSFC